MIATSVFQAFVALLEALLPRKAASQGTLATGNLSPFTVEKDGAPGCGLVVDNRPAWLLLSSQWNCILFVNDMNRYSYVSGLFCIGLLLCNVYCSLYCVCC